MGTGYTVDTPVKVAHLGISSVISIVDDIMIEKMREFYCKKFDIPFKEISTKIEDFRAKRITAYLNLIDEIVKKKFDEFKSSLHDTEEELEKYFDLLPDFSDMKNRFNSFIKNNTVKEDIINWIETNLIPGDIDVNIMTKVDKENYASKEVKLPIKYNDAHAALRGFANSSLESSLVLSAGMNPRLYSYLEEFDDFYPDKNGQLKKKITLKVSDYRSSLIQGKFLAKKGIWVSEYRIESGLNCGGHAFATNGFLLGPILEEFKKSKKDLVENVHDMYVKALSEKGYPIPEKPLPIKITAQGGVGTSEEHNFLLNNYNIDSVGWGSPFLLVPEVVNVDKETHELLSNATEDDLYLSKISPLGVPFNNVRGNSKDLEKQRLVAEGRPGSICPKQLLVSNVEFTERPICTASKQYQKFKITDLEMENETKIEHESKFHKITEKACLCLGLAASALIKNKIVKEEEDHAVSVCPGPNIAYFSGKMSLKNMVDHIYGRINVITRNDRPNFFVKELSLYIDYLKDLINDLNISPPEAEIKKIQSFHKNLMEGVAYYKQLFLNHVGRKEGIKKTDLEELHKLEQEISSLTVEQTA
jgi:hypothetical protein